MADNLGRLRIYSTHMGVSSIDPSQILTSLSGFILFYSTLAVVELYLMIKYIRLGPERSLLMLLDYEILRVLWWELAWSAPHGVCRDGWL